MLDQLLYTELTHRGDTEAAAAVFRRRGAALLGTGRAVAAPSERPWTIEVFVEAGIASRMVPVQVEAGPCNCRDARLRVPLGWRPRPPAMFSTFSGELTFEALSADAERLALVGRYTLPAGTPPAPLMAATRTIARRLLRVLAEQLDTALTPTDGHTPQSGLRVEDVMTRNPVTVRDDTQVVAATTVLLDHGLSGVPVVDRDGDLVGVLTESDLLAREAAPRQRRGVAPRDEAAKRLASSAGDACSRPPLTVGPKTSVQEAVRTLLDRDVSRLVVVEHRHILGVLTRHDVLRALPHSLGELQASIDARLEAAGLHDVHAEMTGAGIVRLTGRVRHRSSVASVEHMVRAVDGVVDVENELQWLVDDVAGMIKQLKRSGVPQAHGRG